MQHSIGRMLAFSSVAGAASQGGVSGGSLWYRAEVAKRRADELLSDFEDERTNHRARCPFMFHKLAATPPNSLRQSCTSTQKEIASRREQVKVAYDDWMEAKRLLYAASKPAREAKLKRELRASMATSRAPSQPSSGELAERSPRMALIMFGDLDYGREHTTTGVHLSGNSSFIMSELAANLNARVLEPAARKGVLVDLFAQSTTASLRRLTHRYYKPVAAHLHPYDFVRGGNMFTSIETGLRLRRAYEKYWRIRYDWVLLLRWDVWFYPTTSFDVTALNSELFYATIFCGRDASSAVDPSTGIKIRRPWKIGQPQVRIGTRTCMPLTPRKDDRNVSTFVEMDFYFASSPAIIDRVFVTLWEDYMAKKFHESSAVLNHGILAGRLVSLHTHSSEKHQQMGDIRMGRYLWHGLTHQLYRDVTNAGRTCSAEGQHIYEDTPVRPILAQSTSWPSYSHNLKAEVPWSSDLCVGSETAPQRFLCTCAK